MRDALDHLDHLVGDALLGRHAPFAEHHGDAVRYAPDVAPFLALPVGAAQWADAARLVGADDTAVVVAPGGTVAGAGWSVERRMPGVRLVAERAVGVPCADAEELGGDDVDAMLALVARTRPGPFARRTVAMGTYVGVRVDGELVAMAGERMRPPGHTEISAVCTRPDHEGRGLAAALVRDPAHRIETRGDTPFLHAVVDNTRAIGLYEHLGFRVRARPDFVVVRAPGAPGHPAGTAAVPGVTGGSDREHGARAPR